MYSTSNDNFEWFRSFMSFFHSLNNGILINGAVHQFHPYFFQYVLTLCHNQNQGWNGATYCTQTSTQYVLSSLQNMCTYATDHKWSTLTYLKLGSGVLVNFTHLFTPLVSAQQRTLSRIAMLLVQTYLEQSTPLLTPRFHIDGLPCIMSSTRVDISCIM